MMPSAPQARPRRLRCDSVRSRLAETGETPCTSVRLRKHHSLQETNLERFPKLDVAGLRPPVGTADPARPIPVGQPPSNQQTPVSAHCGRLCPRVSFPRLLLVLRRSHRNTLTGPLLFRTRLLLLANGILKPGNRVRNKLAQREFFPENMLHLVSAGRDPGTGERTGERLGV
jgi:hypothetical protein